MKYGESGINIEGGFETDCNRIITKTIASRMAIAAVILARYHKVSMGVFVKSGRLQFAHSVNNTPDEWEVDLIEKIVNSTDLKKTLMKIFENMEFSP